MGNTSSFQHTTSAGALFQPVQYLTLVNSSRLALVDDDDFPFVAEYRWHLESGDGISTRTKILGKLHYLYLPRILLNAPDGLQVDHANHNRLDNQKHNLRLATNSQNTANRRKWGTKSKFKGVRWHSRDRQWEAYILSGQDRVYLGYFRNEEDAARQYNRFARLLWAEFALLNAI